MKTYDPPLCLRFRVSDIEHVRALAKSQGLPCSTWIRKVALERAEATGIKVPLTIETAGGVGTQICVRFNETDFEFVKQAAAREGVLPSPWIRAVVMLAVTGERN